MGPSLRPRYVPYTYMDLLGIRMWAVVLGTSEVSVEARSWLTGGGLEVGG